MSYDLMVFDPKEAPRNRGAFKAWYDQTTRWAEGHGYNDPAATTPELRAWYNEIKKTFPNMNGPGAPDDDHLEHITDYSIGHHAIYAAFRWLDAEIAYPLVRKLAVQSNVGFYDVSGDEGDGEIYFPGDTLRPEAGGAWREVAKQFRELGSQ